MSLALAAAAGLLLSSPGVASPAAASDPAPGPSAIERFRGVARSRDGSVAYVEVHEVKLSGGRVTSAETRYERPDGRTIARLVSDYPAGSFAPARETSTARSAPFSPPRRAPIGSPSG